MHIGRQMRGRWSLLPIAFFYDVRIIFGSFILPSQVLPGEL